MIERRDIRGLGAAMLWLCVMTATAQAPSRTAAVTPVTDAMLAKPPPQDWLMWRRTLDSWGYSPLAQVDAGNVRQLQLVWTRGLEPGPQEGTPLVHDGVLYFPNPGDTIQAIDAVTGDLLWEHRRRLPGDIDKFINAPLINRNLAIHGHLVIDTTADGALYAVDARTGEDVWTTQVLDYKTGVHQTSGPLVADGKVFSGRGCEPLKGSDPADCVITAHDAATGRELWRTRTIPGPGEPGNETWGNVPYEERRHVGAWMPPSYDPELKLLYIGTSVTSPAPKFLLGGNGKKHLYHNSTLALDPQTGKIVWYYQHLVDHWDFDHPFERILVDTAVTPDKGSVAWINPKVKPGEVHKVITGIPGKTGIVYTLDRRTGQFLWATPTIHQNVVESIDGRTGEVKVAPGALFTKKGDEATLCPSIVGGKNWPAGAYSPLTGSMYFPLQNTCSHYTVSIESRQEDSAYGLRTTSEFAPGKQDVGRIHAISAATGRTDWKFEQRAGVLSLVTTGGGLLFGGDVAGRFRAFDQRTGDVLWQVNLGSQVTGFPISYAVGDRQFIAVSTGSAVNTVQYLRLTPEIRAGNQNSLFVFALPEGWQAAASASAARPAAAGPSSSPPAVPVASGAGASSCRRDPAMPAVQGGASARGRFSAAQLAEGRRLYAAQQCVTCHGESLRGSPGAPPLADAGFRQAWSGRSLRALFDCTKSTMPPGQAGRLTDPEYAALLAVMLDANGYPAGPGTGGLPADAEALGRIVLD
jgi:PQQ-dependent dehydrogenase (methanol/ethanol family)